MLDLNNFNGYSYVWDWMSKNTKDSYKYADKLGKLGAKIQSLSDKINSLQQIKIEITEKSLENDEKSFTLKVVGNLNLNSKSFIKDIAEKIASILDDYKSKKINELSIELDSTIEEMKNVFPSQPQTFYTINNGVNYDIDNGKIVASFEGDLLTEDHNKAIKTLIDWKEDIK